METMTDWQEPYVEGEKYAGIIGPGLVKRAVNVISAKSEPKISALYKEALELASKIRAENPDRPEMVTKATEGLVHAHPDPKRQSVFSIVPHGETRVPRIKEIPEEGLYAAEAYYSPGLYEHIPDVLSTKIYPQKGMQTGFGVHKRYGDKPGIYLHPNQLAYPGQSEGILAHELTHASAGITDPSSTYMGGSTKYFQDLANRSQLPEQWELATKIRQGAPFDPKLVPKAMLDLKDKDLEAFNSVMTTIKLLRDKGFAQTYYKNLFGEGLARYVERNPNAAIEEVPPWLRPGWDAPRRMKSTLRGRLSGALSYDPFKSSMSNPGDVETALHITDR